MSTIGPFAEPVAGCKPAAPPTLTADQQTKYEQFLEEVRSWESLPTTKAGTETATLSDDERLWLTRECLLRYLRATKWNLQQAITRLRATAVWRREFGTDTFTADYISEENAKGKQVQLGFDKEGRPCLYLLPQNQNTKPSQKQVEHLVYMVERTLDLHPPGQEGLALLIDFRNTGAGGTPPMSISKQVLDILQSHYPERLGRALLTHLPWYVTAFLKLIGPFIDPVTKTKIKYNEPLTDHVPASQLMTASGGEVDFKYDHSIYWPALADMAAERRRQRVERWEKAGKIIGESEIYLWGGEEGSIGGKKEVAPEANGAEKVNKDVKAPAETNGTTSGGDTALVDGVANLDIKTSEPVKPAA
ncbi:CRAL/TRIO domain-containing protein [Ophiobolus disseminans]|uniref:CRAL/TRIO domain-containing protein n=1 Tax=Ophiobolus disseminans TaxID=1469910 RepID=A0A6A6ZXH4_9PLEO|nr:CRAL/TRIO domain-containing protein [Ophiobolus disseminans]